MASGDITADRAEASDMYGASFDGVDDYVEIPNITNNMLLNGFSISMWIYNYKDIGGLSRRIIMKGDDANGTNGFSLSWYPPNSLITGKINAGTERTSSIGSVSLNKWVHFVCTFAIDGTMTWYINGVQKGVPGVSSALSNITTANKLRIYNNSYDTTRGIKGICRELVIYYNTLNQAQVTLLYGGTAINDGVIGYWKLQENYNDSSINGYNATNSGSIFTKTPFNYVKADADSLNLAAATDKIIALPISRDGKFTIIGANRAA